MGEWWRSNKGHSSCESRKCLFFQKLPSSLMKLFNIDSIMFTFQLKNWRSKTNNIPKSHSLHMTEPIFKPMFWWHQTYVVITKPPSRYSQSRRDYLSLICSTAYFLSLLSHTYPKDVREDVIHHIMVYTFNVIHILTTIHIHLVHMLSTWDIHTPKI